jgi:hypothetical protein
VKLKVYPTQDVMTSKESGVGRDAGLVSRFPGRLAEQEQAV